MAESLTLGVLGGLTGLGVAYGALRLLVRIGPASLAAAYADICRNYKTGESLPSNARRTIRMGGVPCARNAS